MGGSGRVSARLRRPPFPIAVELGRGAESDPALEEVIRARLREVLLVSTRIELVPWGTLERSEYKGRLVERA